MGLLLGYITNLRCLTATYLAILEGLTPFEWLYKYTPDIAEYAGFKWFQWVYFHDYDKLNNERIGQWLGPTIGADQDISYMFLTNEGKVVSRSSVNHIHDNPNNNEDISSRKEDFSKKVNSLIGNHSNSTCNHYDDGIDVENIYDTLFDMDTDAIDDEEIKYQELDEKGQPITRPDVDEFISSNDSLSVEDDDKYISMKVLLPIEGSKQEATVLSRKRLQDGTLKGTSSNNPILDTREYTVQFADGTYADYSANVLIENLHEHIDNYGSSHDIIKDITNHRFAEDTIPISKGIYTTEYGTKRRVITTKGCDLYIEWTNGTSSWLPLRDLKESDPIRVAEYATSREIDNMPAFAWWVPHTLKKRDKIIKSVSRRIKRNRLKFGIKVPQTPGEAELLDIENKNTLWDDAVEKEKKNVLVVFMLLEDDELPNPGSTEIPYHFIFDVKHDLTRKARLVAGGHKHKDVPEHLIYSSVASRDSVRIYLMLAALNDLEIKTVDIGSTYLNTKCKEKVHVKVGPELFGKKNEGKTAVIVRALYGLRSSGNAWRSEFSTFITKELGYKSTVADPDVYRKVFKKPDGSQYYSYLIIYVDDVMCVHHNPIITMERIQATYRLKKGIEKTKMYLGTDMRKWSSTEEDGSQSWCWALESCSYVKEVVRVAEQ